MLDKSNMSAPTSLTDSAATIGSGKELYQSLKSSMSEMAGPKHPNRGRPESEMLIEVKFNELAKKILEELKQAQYSKEFFQEIDNIIKEPLSNTLVRPQRTTFCRPKYASQPAQRAAFHGHQQSFGEKQYPEPRSLPVEKQAAPGKQELIRQQQQQAASPSKQKSAIPISNGAHTSSISPKKVATDNGTAYPINKSATFDDATLSRQPSVRKSLITTSQESRKSSSASGTQHSTRHIIKRRFMVTGDEDDEDEDDDDFDNFDDDNDDDDDDDFSGDDYLRRRPSFQGRRQSYQKPQTNSLRTTQLNPIIKSKTLSDATNLQSSDTTSTSKSPNSNKQSTSKQTARQSPLYQHQSSTIQQGTSVAGNRSQSKSSISGGHQRFNPITRSNTVTASNGSSRAAASSIAQGNYNNQERELYSRNSPSEPKSMILNSKDIRSLYKPHMNYSTSVLGNHRLSDDDEIIIIPTQSPSLVSTSPDGEAAQDELTERFSISRTKSFWEKLSKGSSGRRSNGAESNSGESNNGCIIQTGNNKLGRTSNNNNNNQSYSLSGNKASMNMNGHSHTLDRMDSTGGSNSNYNGSSSGDENGACYSSQHNPTPRELEEMSRQNRLRQTK